MTPSISKLALAALASLACVAAQADEVSAAEEAMATKWAEGVDMDRDHLVSRAEVLAIVEKAFAAADRKKTGKLDMKQLATMLREFDPRTATAKHRVATQ